MIVVTGKRTLDDLKYLTIDDIARASELLIGYLTGPDQITPIYLAQLIEINRELVGRMTTTARIVEEMAQDIDELSIERLGIEGRY